MRCIATSQPLGNGPPPKEFRIWAFGVVDTTKGEFLFEAEDARRVMESWRQYGNELSIDYEHKAVDKDARAGDGKASGWFRPEIRKDGLWAADVRWTPAASRALEDREYRYFSPAFVADDDDHISELINIALTNIPATRRMTPLVASRGTIMAADKDEALEAARASKREAAKARLAKAKAEMEAAEAECTALAGTEEEDPEESTQPHGECAADEPSPDGDGKKRPPPGDGPDSEPDGDETAAKQLMTVARELTGRTRPAEVTGALRALVARGRETVTLSKRVEHLEATLRRRDVDQIVASAVAQGKIPPAQREWFTNVGMRSIEELRAYVDTAPARVTTSRAQTSGQSGEPPPPPPQLSGDALKVAKMLGLDPTEFATTCSRPVRVAEGGY